MQFTLVVVYGIILSFIFCYSLIQLSLAIRYLFNKRKEPIFELELADVDKIPVVTIQLPVYNELYVVNRLIDSICELNYPKEKLEIQILDDSTDETTELIVKKVAEKQKEGFQISHIRRKNRKGFKAGALIHGTSVAKGEFIAIFDADFLPKRNFLLRTLPCFNDEQVGVVQTRWEHINRNYSLLTKLQAFALDAHFSVEQKGRNLGGHFINFNGTAGIWRKKAIVDAGGWQSDTLTEDLDLSYRAQIKGWKFIFLEGVGSPAELPATIPALRTQQFRWNKGAAECTQKNLKRVLQADHLPFFTKVHAIFHLLNSSVFIAVLLLALLSIPLLIVKNNYVEIQLIFRYGAVFFSCLIFLAFFYFVSTLQKEDREAQISFWQFLIYFPLFLSLSMGLSLHNAIAVFEGHIGKKTPFVRTPKFNIREQQDKWTGNKYLVNAIGWMTFFELVLGIYFTLGLIIGAYYGDYTLYPLHLMLSFGYYYIGLGSVIHSIGIQKKAINP